MLEIDYINGLGTDSTKDEKLFVTLVEEQESSIQYIGEN